MPRDNYYKDSGNPLRRAMLPTRPLQTALPVKETNPELGRALIYRVGVAVFAIDIASFIISDVVTSPVAVVALAAMLLFVSLILVGFIAVRIGDWAYSFSFFLPGLVTSIAASAALVGVADPRWPWIHAGLLGGAFVWMFLKHWTERCITCPVSKTVAANLRQAWMPSMMLTVAVPMLAFITAFVTAPIIGLLVLCAIAVVQCFAPTLGWSSKVSQPDLACLLSWLTYNADELDVPGVFRSPLGRCGTRCIVTVGVCFVISNSIRVMMPIPVLLPSFVVLALPLLVARPLIHQANVFNRVSVTPDTWSSMVENIRNSPNPIERESFYQGRVLADGSPILIPRSSHAEHVHFLGDTGGGKTALGLAPFMEQAIYHGDASIVCIDLKADTLELLATLIRGKEKVKAERGIDLPLKYLSMDEEKASYAFTPQTQDFWKKFNAYQRTDLLTGATGLNYGTDFGAAFFSAANEGVVKHVIESYPDTETFRELAEQCGYILSSTSNKQRLHPEMRRNGTHVHEILKRLGSIAPLNATTDNGFSPEVVAASIDLADAFRRPQLMYFHLSSVLSPGAAPALARFVAFFLLASATMTERKVPVYLVIDEFQRMVAGNFAYMLQLARSMGVRVVLANQCMEDLKTSKTSLIPTIEANCRYRQWFAATAGEDRMRLSQSSGMTVETFTSYGESINDSGKSSQSQSSSQRVMPRLDINDIALVGDHPKHSIVRMSRGAGYAQYSGLTVVCESDFHIDEEEFERRKHMDWPTGEPGTFVPSEMPKETTPTDDRPVVSTEVVGASNDDPLAEILGAWEDESDESAGINDVTPSESM